MTELRGFIIGIAVLLTSSLSAATLTVDLNGGSDYTDIQSAIDASKDGDTVLVMPGEYVIVESITFKGKAISVKSEGGAEVTTIRMSETPADWDRASVVVFETGEGPDSKLEGFTLTGGKGRIIPREGWSDCGGGGVFCSGSSPTLTNCTISGNSTRYGGGVYCELSSSPILMNCTISGNSASYGGGVYCERNSSPILMNCMISGNSAGSGGGVYCCWDSSTTLRSCTITGNLAHYGGGVYYRSISSPILMNCTILGNSSGGVCCESGSSPTLTNCIVWDNSGASITIDADSSPLVSYSCIEGPEIWPGGGNINLDPRFCGFCAGEAWVADPQGLEAAIGGFRLELSSDSPCLGTGSGGSDMGSKGRGCDVRGEARLLVHLAAATYKISFIILSGRVSLEGAGEEQTILRGTVRGLRSGAVLSDLTVTGGTGTGIIVGRGEAPEITRCTISGNWGNGVHCYLSSPTFTNCTISRNGSGVCCEGSSPTFTRCTISGNSGRGVYCLSNSSPTLTNCTILGNSDRGVDCESNSSPTLTNCTISGNYAVNWNWGGGVACRESSPTLTNCTISGNYSVNMAGGLLCDEGSSPSLTNCIVWGNIPESVCGNLFHCLTDHDPLFVRPGEWVECGSPDDPLCIAYQWNPDTGEPTAWHRWDFDYDLRPGSPAIDAGTCEGAPATDIEGLPRPQGVGCDIGAYEYVQCPLAGETHCLGLEVQGPDGGVPGTYVATVSARDDSGDSISYTFSARRGDEPPIAIGPQAGSTASFDLSIGTWTITVEVDDDPECSDVAADSKCSEVVVVVPPGGLQRPGDTNQDGALDLSDAIWLLGHLFLGTQPKLPCEGGTASSPGAGDLSLADVNGDGGIDISDPVNILGFLFLGEKPPSLGTECVRIEGCPENAGCR